MKDLAAPEQPAALPCEPGYALHVSDRTTAAMQLAAHFTSQSMLLSATDDPRARLAEQLSYFDLAFRSIMSSTARTMIKTPVQTGDADGDGRARPHTGEFRVG
jgi:hypothetical protein